MKAKVIKTDEEHAAALAHMRELMDATPGSPEEEELDLFATLIELYEKGRWPIEISDSIDLKAITAALRRLCFDLQRAEARACELLLMVETSAKGSNHAERE
jgi:antitoxin component HigA of HigAB toxin-antitoxin module